MIIWNGHNRRCFWEGLRQIAVEPSHQADGGGGRGFLSSSQQVRLMGTFSSSVGIIFHRCLSLQNLSAQWFVCPLTPLAVHVKPLSRQLSFYKSISGATATEIVFWESSFLFLHKSASQPICLPLKSNLLCSHPFGLPEQSPRFVSAQNLLSKYHPRPDSCIFLWISVRCPEFGIMDI